MIDRQLLIEARKCALRVVEIVNQEVILMRELDEAWEQSMIQSNKLLKLRCQRRGEKEPEVGG